MKERQPLFKHSDDPYTPLFNELNAESSLPRNIIGDPISEEDLKKLTDQLAEADEAGRIAYIVTQGTVLRDAVTFGVPESDEANERFDEASAAITEATQAQIDPFQPNTLVDIFHAYVQKRDDAKKPANSSSIF